MWQRWLVDLKVQLQWIKRDIIRRWRLDTPAGIMGIIIVISGVLFLVVIGDAIAHIFRLFVPWVSGASISEVYWQSVSFGIKTSLILLLFCGSLIIYFLIRFSQRR